MRLKILVFLTLLAVVNCKSEIQRECEKKIDGLAAMFGGNDTKKDDWSEKRKGAVAKCVENKGELMR